MAPNRNRQHCARAMGFGHHEPTWPVLIFLWGIAAVSIAAMAG